MAAVTIAMFVIDSFSTVYQIYERYLKTGNIFFYIVRIVFVFFYMMQVLLINPELIGEVVKSYLSQG